MSESLVPLIVSEFMVYLIGVLASLMVWAMHRILHLVWPSSAVRKIQQNLAKANYTWLVDSKVVVQIGEEGVYRRNLLIVVALFSVLSWFGLILSLVAVLSLRRLRSPREKNILSSKLATHDLSPEEVMRLAKSFKN